MMFQLLTYLEAIVRASVVAASSISSDPSGAAAKCFCK